MGRKSKPSIKVEIDTNIDNLSLSINELPPFRKFMDFENGRNGLDQQKTRLYFFKPTLSEAKIAKNLNFNLVGGEARNVIKESRAIGEYAKSKISESFAIQLSQLIINSYSGVNLSLNSVGNLGGAVKHFIDFLSNSKNPQELSIFNIEYEDWLDFRSYIENSDLRDKKQNFRTPLSIFSAFAPTSISGSLSKINSPGNYTVVKDQSAHSLLSEDAAYSDSIMYQLLAQFLFRFERQISNLKYFENLNIESLKADWFPPFESPTNIDTSKLKSSRKRFSIIDNWLSSEENYHKILDHKLLWFKIGVSPDQSFARKMQHHAASSKSFKEKFDKYNLWEKDSHFLIGPPPKSNIFGLYVKRSPAKDKTGSMSQLAFCITNIVLIYTGLNKEVVLSWPSRVNGKSILDCGDSLFIKRDGLKKEVEITGVKSRTGILTKDKKIRISIVIDSPLFKMLRDYEKYAKTDFDGPFFEFSSKTIARVWGGKSNQQFRFYKVVDDKGDLLSTINTTKFRKVFATTKMLEHLSGITNAQELADRLRADLHHNNLDVTLSNYIFKSQNSTNVLDIAIATITSEKIKEALKFKGEISLDPTINPKRTTYLCECLDPLNPSHGVSIANKCTYYDLCLGCKQSIVCQSHLPYICFRILQYEKRRNEMGVEWNAIFEDKWIIAHDTLQRYINQDKENGVRLVEEAWEIAKTSKALLPPIIMTKF